MTGILTAIKGSRVGMYVVIGVAFLWGLVLLVGKLMSAGAAKERGKQMEETVETQRRIQDADAAGPRTADDVDRRLRDGTF